MSNLNHLNLKLGKLDPKEGKLSLHLSNYITVEVYYAPVLERNSDISDWTMMGNNTIGDCTCAAAGHGIMSWTDDAKNLVTPSLVSIINAYVAVSGYNPSTGQNDNGAACTTVLDYWKDTGINGHKIAGYTYVNVHNGVELKQAIYTFGLIYIGIQLPVALQSQINESTWTIPNAETTSLTGDWAPGSWGGHCVIVIGYNEHGLDIVSWGKRYTMSWAFWKCYIQEAYAIISEDFLSNGKAINGLNITQLQSDLNLV